jgi:outer membrane protein OmpU
MKKTLYGTTAIVALGLAIVAAAPASAQAPAAGFSSTNFQFTVGGLARGYVGGTSMHDNVATWTANNGANPTVGQAGATQRFDVQRDWRLDLTAAANLPNGMRATTVVQLQNLSVAGGSTFTESYIRRNWVALSGGFGDVRIGSIDPVTMQMAQGAMDAFTAGSAKTGKIYDYMQTANVFGRDDTALGATNNIRLFDRSSEKIAYFTPRIEGFQLGVNYTPEASKDKNSALATSAGGVYNRGYAAAVNYVNTFSGVGVRASASYIKWNAPINAANGGVDPSDASAWGLGAGFTYMGFDLGGSYGNYSDVMSAGRVDGGAAIATITNRFIGDGSSYEIGLGYSTGPVRVSLNWFAGEMKSIKNVAATGAAAALTAGTDKLQTIALNGAYILGPGVNLEASLFNSRSTAPFTSAVANVRNKQDATGIVTGIILSF